MSIREPYMTKTVEGDTQFTLSADAGESLLVTGIRIATPSGTHVTLAVDKTTVGYFRVSGNLGNHLFFPQANLLTPNLLDVLIANGWMSGYPIAEGEQLALTGVHQSTSIVAVEYIKADAGDFKRDMPNGSASNEYLFLSYGRYSTTLADGDNVMATVQTPVEFPAFPFGDVVPARTEITLLGIAASDIGVTTGTAANQHESQYLKLMRERATLLDDSRDGQLNRGVAPAADGTAYGAGQSMLGNNSDADLRSIFKLPEPIVFSGGEELIVNFHTELVAGAVNLPAVDCEVGMILAVKKQ